MPRVLIGSITAAMLLIFLGPKFIAWLRENEVGQFVRAGGLIPEAHAEKHGTPTMGGLLILLAMTLPFVILSTRSTAAMAVLFTTLACGAVGFVDDFMKVVKRRSLGLSGTLAHARPAGDRRRAGLGGRGHRRDPDHAQGPDRRPRVRDRGGAVLRHRLPGRGRGGQLGEPDRRPRRPGRRDRAIALLTYIGDGLRHPAGGPAGQRDLALFGATLVGACVGFLWFNSFPAAIFMGDTGSYALGGAIAAMAVMTKTEILLVCIGAVFVIEALSVIVQVVVFKRFHRRVFLMTPIHHHFEMAAWSETKIIVRFWLIAAIFGAVGFTLYFRACRDEPRPWSWAWRARGGPPPLLLAREGWEAWPSTPRAVDAPELAGAGVEVRAPHDGAGRGGRPGGQEPRRARRRGARGRGPRRGRAGVERGRAGRARGCPTRSIGVTGTNGKTTTTELTAHLLRAGGACAAVACGNQGTPLAGLVGAVDPGAWLVVECSSFQLEDAHALHPRAAVLLNLAPDHLDRHGGLERLPRRQAAALRRPRSRATWPSSRAPLAATGPAPARRLYQEARRARTRPPGPPGACTSPGRAWWPGGTRCPARPPQPREPMAAAALAPHAGARRRGDRRRAGGLPGRGPPPGGGGRGGRRALRQRLQGHQPRGGHGRARRLSRAACT